jgi:CRP-like cAMP-binding protein
MLGQYVDHCMLVVDGLVGRFDQLPDGRREITALHVPGDIADLPSLVNPKAGWALQALTTTTILRLPHKEMRRLASEDAGITEALWRDCVVDASIFSQWVVNVGRRDARARMAHLWCEMAIRAENAGIGSRASFKLDVTQADLADILALTAVHVNRTLQALRATGIVTVNARTVQIHDWNALVEVGEFDPAYLLLDGPFTSSDDVMAAIRT